MGSYCNTIDKATPVQKSWGTGPDILNISLDWNRWDNFRYDLREFEDPSSKEQDRSKREFVWDEKLFVMKNGNYFLIEEY